MNLEEMMNLYIMDSKKNIDINMILNLKAPNENYKREVNKHE